jgi:uncharacterized damage-inducible protein DinB
MGLDMSTHLALMLIDDMKDAPLTFPTPKGGNHPLWVLGHLAWTEGELQHVMLGKPNPMEHWKPIFGAGSEPMADPKKYPSFAEAKKAFMDLRAESIEFLNTLSDDDLDKPSAVCPPEAAPFIGTYGKCFMIAIVNSMMHRGQVADARRAIGRKPLRM